MGIIVGNLIEHGILKRLKLIAGKDGFNNNIEKVGILDHEIVEQIEGSFGEGDFVISTFTPARNDERLLIRSIKELIRCEASALAIKNVYYKELPEEIIQFADKEKFPIFMYDEEIYSEYIIEEIMHWISSRTRVELMESKIDILFKGDLNKGVVEQLAYELNANFHNDFVVYYCRERRYFNDENLLKCVERYNRSRGKVSHHGVFKYHEGIMVILSFKKYSQSDLAIDKSYIFKLLDINEKDFKIGKSRRGYGLRDIDRSIKESIYATDVDRVSGDGEIDFGDIGIYQVLIPHKKDRWLRLFSREILKPIKEYDQGKFIETAKVFIKNGGDVAKTAEELFQHKNTIRYRINIMKGLIGAEGEGEFYEKLSVAIKIDMLNKNKGE